MKKVIIVTGGIASGKSYIIKLMSDLGYKTIKSDEIARDIMNEVGFKNQLGKIIGKNQFDLKEEIEKNEYLLDTIEEIIYPHIDKIRRKFIGECHEKNLIPVIEIPLFFEKNIEDKLKDYYLIVISTICGKATQVARVAIRNKNISEKLLNIIISRQISDTERVARSNFVIYTLSKKFVVKKQLNKILKAIECLK
jgi:dephospho-CoA kinase